MEFYNEIKNPPPPPPAPAPAMPYQVVATQYASAGPGSSPKEWPTKVTPSGRQEFLTDDELAVWRRVQWLEGAIQTAPTAPPPELPYRVELLTFGGLGVVRQHLTKVRPNCYGEAVLLTPDELAVHEYLQTLELRFQKIQIERELAVLDSPTVPPELAATLSDPITVPPETLTDPNTADFETASEQDVARLTSANIPPTVPDANDTQAPTANALATSANSEDKRARAIAELLSDPSASNGVLSERAGCSDEFVRKLRKVLEAEGRLAPVAVVTRRDGAAYHLNANAADSPAEAAVGDVPTAAPTGS